MKGEAWEKRAEQFYERFDRELAGEYERLTEFRGAHQMLTARHIPCGELRTAAARDFFRKDCPVCKRAERHADAARRQATDYVKRVEDEYDVTALSEFTGLRGPMQWRCNKCGAVFERPVERIIWAEKSREAMPHDCDALRAELMKQLILALKKRTRQVQVEERRKKKIEALCDTYRANGYQVVKIYDDLNRVALRHLECGRVFTTDIKRMRHRYGCKRCAVKGLSFIVQQTRTYLERRGIAYIREATFPTCRLDNPLPFDFVLTDAQGNPTHAIEVNGEQHYKAFAYFGGQDKLKEIQAADSIKAEWCRQHDLPLLVIRYDADVEAELNKFLQ